MELDKMTETEKLEVVETKRGLLRGENKLRLVLKLLC